MVDYKEALTIAKAKLHRAIRLSECGYNEGIRAIYGKEAEWLSVIIYNAEENIMRKENNNGKL
jgi:hypothetical protein